MPNRSTYSLLLIFLVLFADQTLKVWIKLNMSLGESFSVLGLDWFQIYFIENRGMAFGMELDINYGKLILSSFRILAVSAIGYFLWQLIKRKVNYIVLSSVALIFAGALGNIIDSALYGLIFSNSTGLSTAYLTEWGQGYAPLLKGNVVDMFYFPLIDTTFPAWVPFVGDQPFKFFQAIFNIADAAICIGVALIFLFKKYFFVPTDTPKNAVPDSELKLIKELK